jgi:hypothetical protein
MTRFVNVAHPIEHPGVARFERVAAAVAGFHPLSATLAALAWVGAPVRSVAAKIGRGLAARAARRVAARQDQLLWQLALTDARIMADLSRAMSDSARRDVKVYE